MCWRHGRYLWKCSGGMVGICGNVGCVTDRPQIDVSLPAVPIWSCVAGQFSKTNCCLTTSGSKDSCNLAAVNH